MFLISLEQPTKMGFISMLYLSVERVWKITKSQNQTKLQWIVDRSCQWIKFPFNLTSVNSTLTLRNFFFYKKISKIFYLLILKRVRVIVTMACSRAQEISGRLLKLSSNVEIITAQTLFKIKIKPNESCLRNRGSLNWRFLSAAQPSR